MFEKETVKKMKLYSKDADSMNPTGEYTNKIVLSVSQYSQHNFSLLYKPYTVNGRFTRRLKWFISSNRA